MFSQVQQALDHLSAALDKADQAPTAELRQTLRLAKQLRSRVELLETKAASLVAQREQHGDGGAGLLNQIGGLSRSEAARNVRTDTELAQMPAARAGVSDGEISLANAARLAQAARKTSPQAVEGDAEFVELAKALPADEFAQAAQRWTIRHQSAEELAVQHRRNRHNRNVRFWNGDDGSVQMRGSFDAEMGARIQNRLRQHAEQLRQADRRRARNSEPGGPADGATDGMTDAATGNPTGVANDSITDAATTGSANSATDGMTDAATEGPADKAARSRDQRMADALDGLLAAAGAPLPGVDAPLLQATDASAPQGSDAAASTGASPTSAAAERKAPAAEIIVRADLKTLLGESGGFAEIPGIGPIPASAVERLVCNSNLSVTFFGDKLTPLYETTANRAPTAAQRRALIARDGVCIGCGAPPAECEAHHIVPWVSGGKTRVDNLVLVCWSCHDLIHDHNWQVVVRDGRFRVVPPDAAHNVNPARSRKPNRSQPRTGVPRAGPPEADAPRAGGPRAGATQAGARAPAELEFIRH